MESESTAESGEQNEPRAWAVVHCGDKYVEVTDEAVTLQDLCSAFEVAYTTGVHIADCATKRAVSTLPFECLPKPLAEQRIRMNYEEVPEENQTAYSDDDDSADDDDDGKRKAKKMIHFELVHAPSDVNNATETHTETAGVIPAKHSYEDDDDDDGDSNRAPPRQVMDNSAARDLNVVMQYLAKLGALQVLSAELPQRLESMPRYSIQDAPHLLNCCVYADHLYSPYRRHRDPLVSEHATKRRIDSADGLYDSSPPYRSAVEVYNVSEAVFESDNDAHGPTQATVDTTNER